MRIGLGVFPAALLVGTLFAACGSSDSGSRAPDSGFPGTGVDAGATTDGGTPADGGGTPTDGGATASECDGLTPAAPGAALTYAVHGVDSLNDACLPADSDGTGVGAFRWENPLQPHDTHVTLVNLGTNAISGTFSGTRYQPIGQASGFIGTDVYGALATTDVTAINPDGTIVHRSGTFSSGNGPQANDPTGGFVLLRAADSSSVSAITLDAWDASGVLRWSRLLPDNAVVSRAIVGVDRAGNVLALWDGSSRFGAASLAGQWYDHSGSGGAVFNAGSTSAWPTLRETRLYERVGSGLFLWVRTYDSSGSVASWRAEYPPMTAGFNAPPAWLVARPETRLHMVHGGAGYAVLPVVPLPGTASPCSQTIEVVAPSGTSCGFATFPIAGGACTPMSIDVGYDGSVIQQLPTAMETCSAGGGHLCTCTWRRWNGFFR